MIQKALVKALAKQMILLTMKTIMIRNPILLKLMKVIMKRAVAKKLVTKVLVNQIVKKNLKTKKNNRKQKVKINLLARLQASPKAKHN